jgi:fatty-acyl-CoA synthase
VLGRLLGGASTGARALAAVARSGLLGPGRPDRLARVGLEVERRGPMAAVASAAAIRWGDAPALCDELGTLSFVELDRRSNALARGLLDSGVRPGDGIGILCRNHRGFLDASFSAAKAGLRAVYLNTEFAGPQIADVCERERIGTLVLDAEYEERAPRLARTFRAWDDGGPSRADATLEGLIAAQRPDPVPVPAEAPTIVMLTSGTTGTPKGAPRQHAGTIVGLGALLERVPFRTRGATWIGPPMFHALGFSSLGLALAFGSVVHTRRRFDPAEVLAGIERERCTVAIVVPAMLQRILALGPEELSERDTSSLRVVFCGGSQLPGPVATATLEAFGDVLYVLYGSTEVAYVSISTPADHRAAPASVGRPALGARVRLLDEDGREVPRGRPGRIFVSNGLEFAGYSDGQTKEIVDGLMSTGDVGHLDERGRLYIDGRDDEMIVSGGENVFPQEVEELLAGHPAIVDAAVVGVEDERLGERLAAHVVLADEARLAADEVRRYVGDNLARYKVPRDVRFHDRLPRNATGKVLKRELRIDR